MKFTAKLTTILLGFLLATSVVAQNAPKSDDDILIEAAVEALITAPPERALPIAQKVLNGDHSDNVKEKALFVLSQIDDPAAQNTLIEYATSGNGELQEEAIRMIGIGGNKDGLAQLRQVYDGGDTHTREAVLEALMIADDKATVYEIALTAEGDDYENAVDMLGVMNANDELRELRRQRGASEELLDAAAISGDFETLREIANSTDDPELQAEAIERMGIVGGDEVGAELVNIYRNANSEDVREAAINGLFISGDDEAMMQLYQATDDPRQKKELLQRLVMMDSDAAWEAIDKALEGSF